MPNSPDPDQLAEANSSGSTLFAKTGHVVLSKRRDKKEHLMIIMRQSFPVLYKNNCSGYSSEAPHQQAFNE